MRISVYYMHKLNKPCLAQETGKVISSQIIKHLQKVTAATVSQEIK